MLDLLKFCYIKLINGCIIKLPKNKLNIYLPHSLQHSFDDN